MKPGSTIPARTVALALALGLLGWGILAAAGIAAYLTTAAIL